MRVEAQTKDKGRFHGSATIRKTWHEGSEFLARNGLESARLDSEILLCFALGISREDLYRELEAPVSKEAITRFWNMLWRRFYREPIAYILGEKEFRSLSFFVNSGVLVPRPETEHLVEVTLDLMACRQNGEDLKVLDLGTGCGAVAICLAKARSDAQFWASDISSEALGVARRNSADHGVEGKIQFFQGDLFEPFQFARPLFDMIVSNPPYVRCGDFFHLAPDVRDWEPREALDGGLDGLNFYRRMCEKASDYLKEGGIVILEIGAEMGKAVGELFSGTGRYTNGSLYRDYAGRERVIVFRKYGGCYPGTR